MKLVSRTNVYINSRGRSLNLTLVEGISAWVAQMLRMFGLGGNESEDLTWGDDSQPRGSANFNVGNISYLLYPFIITTHDSIELLLSLLI